jgi:Domain of unknown function (DUF4907)
MPTNHEPSHTRLRQGPSSRQWLLLALIGLAIMTAYQQYSRQPHYELRVTATPGGWGYLILQRGNPLIDQPTVPGRPGSAGFSTRQQAQRAGELVLRKLQQGRQLPTLSSSELRQINLTTP